jgi:cytochrome P450
MAVVENNRNDGSLSGSQAKRSAKTPPIARLATRDALQDPLSYFLNLTLQYGDLVCYRAAPEPGYLVSQPAYVKHILVENNQNYTKETYINQMFKKAVGDGLLTSEGEEWRRQRRMMQGAFHQNHLAKMDNTIAEIVEEMLAHWQVAADNGTPIHVAREMAELTLKITTNLLFGVDLGAEARVVGEAVDLGGALLERPNNPRFKTGITMIADVVHRLIAERRRSPDKFGDLLSLLLTAKSDETGQGMDDRLIRDQVITLLLAGYETTASALTWTLYLLSQHPEVMAVLQAEVNEVLGGNKPGYADLPRLEYTRMVFEETLRLYPPAWVLGRKVINDDELGDFTIPADTILAISPYTLHRHPQFWERPDVFDPMRFTKDHVAGQNRFAYIPFGAGPRKCIGNNLAMLEAQLAIAMIAQRFSLRLIADQPIRPEVIFVLRGDRNMRVILEPVR